MRVDLNADLGEGAAGDAALMRLVTSVNVACGAHAGDPETMLRTVALAAAHGLAVGAHPGYPDRASFGRRELALAPGEVFELVREQVRALDALLRAERLTLRHVKPHGALYNRAACDAAVADAVVAASLAQRADLIVVGPPGSQLEAAARRAGARFAAEVFADRTYQDDGSLTPRSDAGAFVHDPEAAAERVTAMLAEGRVRSTSGAWVAVRADTVCVHGDAPEAVAFTTALVQQLSARGVLLRALGDA